MPHCVTCPVYRPDSDPRLPNRPPVCDADRALLDTHLWDIPDLYSRLGETIPAPANSPYPVEAANGTVAWRGVDPIADILPAGPVRGQTRQPRVSGTRQPQAPTSLERIDLTLPARPATRALYARGVLGIDADQVGTLSVATILDTWVRDWRATLWPDQQLPTPTVPELAQWLRNRAGDACDQHPTIDEFAAEIKDLRRVLRAHLGETAAQPETDRYKAVACQKCDLRGVLLRRPGSDYIECGNCGNLYTEDEYAYWLDRLAGYERSQRTPAEIAELLRQPVTRQDAA